MQSKGDISLLVARPPSHFHSSSFNLEEEGFVDEMEDILEYVEDHDEDQDKPDGDSVFEERDILTASTPQKQEVQQPHYQNTDQPCTPTKQTGSNR